MFVTHDTKYQFICPSDSGRIPSDFGQINLALEDLIPTCVPRNLMESAESGGFQKMRPVRNGKKSRMHNLDPDPVIWSIVPSSCTVFWYNIQQATSHMRNMTAQHHTNPTQSL